MIAAWLRSAVWGAVSHLVYSRLIELILPLIEHDGSVVAATVMAPSLLDEGAAEVRGGGWIEIEPGSTTDRFLRTIIYWQRRASQEVLLPWQQPDHPRHQLWLAFNDCQKRLREARQVVSPGPVVGPDAYDCWMQETIPESSQAALELLLLAGIEPTHRQPHRPLIGRHLAAEASAKIDALSWAATIGREAFKRYIYVVGQMLIQGFGAYEKAVLEGAQAFFADRLDKSDAEAALPLCSWLATGLRNQPWEHHRACVAISMLWSPEPADRERAVRFFAAFARRYPLLRAIWGDDGGFDRVTLLLLFGLRVAEELIYPVWPQWPPSV
ncbi:MAG TPA: hypothetical protein VLI05_02030 [Candidatus Saccharimonadia bacterium]|nr:hypothetical protein [Candidatus Saccharimonadia bacterium]